MFVVRELARLLSRIAIAVLIAIAIAGVRAIVSGGDTFWTVRIVLMLLGGLMLLLAGTGTGSAASRRVNWTIITWRGDSPLYRALQPKPTDPRLTPTAVFVGSGVVLLAIGAVA